MRNRAKCKLCQTILESFHTYDLVSCKCGEISISGGNVNLECSAKNWENFLRIDENGNEIMVKVVNREPSDESVHPMPSEGMTKQETIQMLETMLKNIENLPNNALAMPVTHYDFYSYLMVVLSILKHTDKN